MDVQESKDAELVAGYKMITVNTDIELGEGQEAIAVCRVLLDGSRIAAVESDMISGRGRHQVGISFDYDWKPGLIADPNQKTVANRPAGILVDVSLSHHA